MLNYMNTVEHQSTRRDCHHLLRPSRLRVADATDKRRLQLPLDAGTMMTCAETEFAYRIDRWDTTGGNIIQNIANMNDLELAMAAYEAACKQWPGEVITLRQGA